MIKRVGDIVLIQLSDIDSNIYIIGDVAIDSGTGFNFTRLMTALSMLKRDLGDIKLVINTHEHFDHIGGNGYFTNARIWAHEDAVPVMEDADTEISRADFFGGSLHPMTVEKKLKDGETVKIGKREFRVIHTPGHTPGSMCLYCEKEKLLISGDTVFADGVGITDIPGGDPEALGQSLEKLSELAVEKILPGHGNPVEKGGSKIIKDILNAPGP